MLCCRSLQHYTITLNHLSYNALIEYREMRRNAIIQSSVKVYDNNPHCITQQHITSHNNPNHHTTANTITQLTHNITQQSTTPNNNPQHHTTNPQQPTTNPQQPITTHNKPTTNPQHHTTRHNSHYTIDISYHITQWNNLQHNIYIQSITESALVS